MKYTETTFETTKEYQLEDDSIFVKGKIFCKGEFETKIQLSELQSEPNIVSVRSNNFFAGFWLFIIPLFVSLVLVQGLGMEPTHIVLIMLYIMCVSGVLLSLSTIKKVRYVQFLNKSGVPTLLIAKAGKDVSNFDDFISKLEEAINNNVT